MNIQCLGPQRVDLVKTLPDATTELTQTPYRYYIVPVMSCTVMVNNSWSPIADFPAYLMLDSGTTNVQLPSASAAAQLNQLGTNGVTKAHLVLGTPAYNVTIEWTQADASWLGQPTFAAMDTGFNSLSYQLSGYKANVGILGSSGMRNLFMQFNMTHKWVGFAQINASGSCA